MRYSAIAIAPFVAAAYAQNNAQSVSPIVVPVDVGGSTSLSTYTYSNTMTNFLSLTNSDGVVTGMPTLTNGGVGVAETSQPAVVTEQPAVATIPAGLPIGTTAIYIGAGPNGTSVSSFIISVGTSTTVVIGGNAAPTDASITTGASAGVQPSRTGSGSNSEESDNPSATESGASESSEAAAGNIKAASAAVLGLGALFVGLL